eukprot:10551041-Prorocentrum_lima.AAC.1
MPAVRLALNCVSFLSPVLVPAVWLALIFAPAVRLALFCLIIVPAVRLALFCLGKLPAVWLAL